MLILCLTITVLITHVVKKHKNYNNKWVIAWWIKNKKRQQGVVVVGREVVGTLYHQMYSLVKKIKIKIEIKSYLVIIENPSMSNKVMSEKKTEREKEKSF